MNIYVLKLEAELVFKKEILEKNKRFWMINSNFEKILQAEHTLFFYTQTNRINKPSVLHIFVEIGMEILKGLKFF